MARHFAPVIPPNDPRLCQPWLNRELRRISGAVQQGAAGLSAIVRGEAPDGSGSPLIDLNNYFFRPGIFGGQTAFGDQAAGGTLTLSSTANAAKGFIYFGTVSGTRAAYDETQGFLGLGIDTPSARFHIKFASPGTTTRGAIGNLLLQTTIGASDVMTWTEYQNNAGAYDVAILSGGLAASRGIYFTDYTLSTGMRFAFGTYGSDTVVHHHLQVGKLNSDGTTANRNLLIVGFNDNCAQTWRVHAEVIDFHAEGNNFGAGTPPAGYVSQGAACVMGLNSPPALRTGTSLGDQPTLTVCAATAYGTQYSIPLRLVIGTNFTNYNTDGANARAMAFEIKAGTASGADTAFAIDRWGRLMMTNPGNGALTYRIAGNRYAFEVTTDVDATTVTNVISCQNINGFTDGSGKGTYCLRLGDGLAGNGSVRWAAFTSSVSGSFGTAFDRLAINAKLTMICDGALDLTNSPAFSVPNALLHIKSSLSTATRLLALHRKTSQSVDIMTVWDNDGSTALSGLNSAGAYYLVAGAGNGKLLQSDAGGVGSWVSLSALAGAAALTEVDDTNVTMAVSAGGATALLAATSLTLGWTGTLATSRGGTGAANLNAFALLASANLFTTTNDITPATDVAALTIHSTNQTLGSLTSTAISIFNPSGLEVMSFRNSGRFQLGVSGDTTLDGIVRFSINCSPTQSVNLFQCTDGTDTLFSCNNRGGFVMGANSTGLDSTIRLQMNFSATQSVNVLAVNKSGSSMIRIQSNGNILVGGSSTGAFNNGYQKLTVQVSSSETIDMVQFTSGITGATAMAWGKNACMLTGRIKTAVLFTNDSGTAANDRLLGFSTSLITQGVTRTLTATDRDGSVATSANAVVDASTGNIVTHNGDMVLA